MAEEKAIIIVKKKGGHGGHHGGAWKVAYADFVTAMMAFFMVMWLINSAESTTREAIAVYFRKPGIFEQGSGVPIMIGGAGILPDSFAPNLASKELTFKSGVAQVPMGKRSGDEDAIKKAQEKLQGQTGRGILEDKDKDSTGYGIKENSFRGKGKGNTQLSAQQLKEKVAADIKKQLAGIPELAKMLGTVDVKIEADGIIIEIMDSLKQSMFELGSSTINPLAKAAFFRIAEVIKNAPNNIDVVGHTDAKPFGRGFKGYTNWELSSDRANAARRLLEESGIEASRFGAVVGKADRELRLQTDPFSEQNRRITLKIKFPTNLNINDPSLLNAALENQEAEEEEEPEITHSLTSEEILKLSKQKDKAVNVLPDNLTENSAENAKPSSNQESRQQNLKIFDEFPIISKEPF